jgi:hypothetical protein
MSHWSYTFASSKTCFTVGRPDVTYVRRDGRTKSHTHTCLHNELFNEQTFTTVLKNFNLVTSLVTSRICVLQYCAYSGVCHSDFEFDHRRARNLRPFCWNTNYRLLSGRDKTSSGGTSGPKVPQMALPTFIISGYLLKHSTIYKEFHLPINC